MAREKLKKDKICLVCGENFKATGKVNTCGGACRIKLMRLKKEDKKPEYAYIAKSRGQEIPEWIAVKLKADGLFSTQSQKTTRPKTENEPTKDKAVMPSGLGKIEMLRWHKEHR